MNISTGGPHILLFERDQQFTTLLVSEFQLAGYECHTARTAVEVFDAIARYPVQLVLVNMAQAAAARREFWVALDTQRRGRGVQVLTFQCFNLAGYGPHDPEDRVYATVEMQIDGMAGLMNLVEAVRIRVPGTASNTSLRLPKAGSPVSAPIAGLPSQPTPRTGQTTEVAATRTGTMQYAPSQPAAYAPIPSTPALPQFSPVLPPLPQNSPTSDAPSYTDKIRAVLYPNQRQRQTTQSSSTLPVPDFATPTYDTPPQTVSPPSSAESTLQRMANGERESDETGLAQLSRMVQEHRSIAQQEANTASASSISSPRPTPKDEPISIQPLRASPIQDLPAERGERPNNQQSGNEQYYQESTSYSTTKQEPEAIARPPLASISNALAAHAPAAEEVTSLSEPVVPKKSGQQPSIPAASEDVAHELAQETQPLAVAVKESSLPTPTVFPDTKRIPAEVQRVPEKETLVKEIKDRVSAFEEVEMPTTPEYQPAQPTGLSTGIPSNAILDIVQSLPPMSDPALQQQIFSWLATRTLGSVLLEGHLVPQSRLEVAQGIQRMLRGVDLNYQLGEILLMFKLLTPDQLLAASLVSYGLISTQQIAALGRIRQELHSIGLEYDLENLLILFRILTPEQLREVRSSWQG